MLYRAVKSTEDQLTLQKDLESLSQWATTWGMRFNPSKCIILTIARSEKNRLLKFYTMDGVVLSHVQEAKYLGILISDDLHWSKHVQMVSSKANSILGLLRRNLHHCPQQLREQAFISLVRSRLEYSATAWDPHLAKDIKTLEMVQRRGARFVKQDYDFRSSVTNLLQDLNWAPLMARRRDLRLALLYKIINDKVVDLYDHRFLNHEVEPFDRVVPTPEKWPSA